MLLQQTEISHACYPQLPEPHRWQKTWKERIPFGSLSALLLVKCMLGIGIGVNLRTNEKDVLEALLHFAQCDIKRNLMCAGSCSRNIFLQMPSYKGICFSCFSVVVLYFSYVQQKLTNLSIKGLEKTFELCNDHEKRYQNCLHYDKLFWWKTARWSSAFEMSTMWWWLFTFPAMCYCVHTARSIQGEQFKNYKGAHGIFQDATW